jgi:hypothetical protein
MIDMFGPFELTKKCGAAEHRTKKSLSKMLF